MTTEERPKYPEDFTPFEVKAMSDDEIDALVGELYKSPAPEEVTTESFGDTMVEYDEELGCILILRKIALFVFEDQEGVDKSSGNIDRIIDQ